MADAGLSTEVMSQIQPHKGSSCTFSHSQRNAGDKIDGTFLLSEKRKIPTIVCIKWRHKESRSVKQKIKDCSEHNKKVAQMNSWVSLYDAQQEHVGLNDEENGVCAPTLHSGLLGKTGTWWVFVFFYWGHRSPCWFSPRWAHPRTGPGNRVGPQAESHLQQHQQQRRRQTWSAFDHIWPGWIAVIKDDSVSKSGQTPLTPHSGTRKTEPFSSLCRACAFHVPLIC